MIIINGVRYSGNKVSIINDQVWIDGKLATEENTKLKIPVTIEIKGPLEKLEVDGDVIVNGDISGSVKANGSVNANDISGDVNAGGNINCDDINGNANAGGSIKCDDISGNACAGASIKY